MNQKTEEWLAQVGKNLSDRDKQLTERAAETIEGNIWTDAVWYPYSCIAPFRSGKDSALWGWDSAFHAITVSRWDTQLASECLEGFMNYQLPSGAFPDVVSAQGTVETRCSKPPLLAHACEAVYRKTGDKFFLKRAYMRLLQNERYLCENRKYGGMFYYDATDRNDPEYYIWARNDTGLDNSVRWDDYCAEYWPIDLNCFAVMMYRSLRFMAEELRDAERLNEWEQKEQELTRLINESLWNEELCAYTDVNRYTKKKSSVLSPASFMPLYIQIAPDAYADGMNRHAMNRKEFYPGMPTAPYNHPAYLNSYWRGPTWLNTAYFAAKGLKNYGFAVADEIKNYILDMVASNDDAIYENYDSIAKKGQYAPHFSWSACFVIEFILDWND